MNEEIDDKFIKSFEIEMRKGEFEHDPENPERLAPETLYSLQQFLNRGNFFVRMCEDLGYWRTAKRYAPRLIELAARMQKLADRGEKEQTPPTGRTHKVSRDRVAKS